MTLFRTLLSRFFRATTTPLASAQPLSPEQLRAVAGGPQVRNDGA